MYKYFAGTFFVGSYLCPFDQVTIVGGKKDKVYLLQLPDSFTTHEQTTKWLTEQFTKLEVNTTRLSTSLQEIHKRVSTCTLLYTGGELFFPVVYFWFHNTGCRVIILR